MISFFRVSSIAERKRNTVNSSRRRLMGLFLTVVILSQMLAMVIAPVKTYAATHMYNYERYVAVATPYGPFVDPYVMDTSAGVENRPGDTGSITYRAYSNYRFDTTTGEYILYGSSGNYDAGTYWSYSDRNELRYVSSYTISPRSGSPVTYTTPKNELWWAAHTLRNNEGSNESRYKDYLGMRVFTAQPSGYNYSAGAHLATVQALDGSYPANGRASDGYYYVRTDVINSPPILSITTTGYKYISGPGGASPTLYINGTASDPDGDTLFISAMLGNVTKTATITPGNWQLGWSYSEFNREGMEMLTIAVNDGYGGVYSTLYSGTIVIDMTPPTAPTLSADRGGWHNGNKVITIAHGEDYISGVLKSQYQIGSGSWLDYTAPFTVSDRVTVNARTLDQAGNVSAVASLDSLIDKVPPSPPSLSADRSGWHNGNKVITIGHGTDALSGVLKSQYQIGNGSWIDYAAPFTVTDRVAVSARTLDRAGNISSVTTLDTEIDKTEPTPPSLAADRDGWHNGDKIISLSHGQVGPSGVLKSQIQIDSGNWTDYAAPFTVSDRVTIHGRTLDQAGNIGPSVTLDTQIDKISPDEPTIEIAGGADWQSTNKSITITHGVDEGGSGIKDTEYRVNGGNWAVYAGPLLVTDEGQAIEARTWDQAGNVSNVASADILIDKTPPTIPSINIDPPGDTAGNVELTITPGTDTASGVKVTEYKVGAASNWQSYTGPFSLTEEGEHQIFARSTDNAGNISVIANEVAVIDRTPPTAPSIMLSSGSFTAEDVQFTISGSTETRSFHYEYRIGNGSYVAGDQGEVALDGITVITARAVDAAGNISAETAKTVCIDKKDPVIQMSPSQRGWSADPINATIQYQDDGSGINPDRRYYKVTSSPDEPSSWDLATSNNLPVQLTDEGTWYIHAKVEDNVGNSAVSSSAAMHLQQLPEVPELSVQSVGLHEAALQWTLPTGNAYTDGYQYTLRNLTTGQSMNIAYSADRVVDHSLAPGTNYEYELTVRNHVGESISNTIRLLTLPAAPASLSLFPVDRESGQLRASFDAVQSADSYRIVAYQMPQQHEVYNQTVTDSVYQSVLDLQPGTVYNVAVSAINATGEGPAVHQSILSLPDRAEGFRTVTIGENAVDMTWHSVTTATYYTLDRDGIPVTESVYEAYSDTGLASGTRYHYRLAAINRTGPGAYSHLGVLTLPGMVNGLDVAEARRNELEIAWNRVRGASGYRIMVDGVEEKRVGEDSMTATIQELSAGSPVKITVQAYNSSGYGVTNDVYGLTLPDQPSEACVSDIQEQSAVISWAPIHGATKYSIEIDGRSYTTADTQMRVTGLSAGTTYSFKLTAGNASGYGESRTGKLLTLPGQVVGFAAQQPQDQSFRLSWEPVKSATSYIVYQGTEEIGTTSETSLLVKDLQPGQNYSYRVIALNDLGTGAPGNFHWRTYPSAIQTGEAWITDITTHSAAAEWVEIAGADYYKVYLDSELLGDTTALRYEFAGFDSSELHMAVIEPVNSSGASSRFELPFETLPDSEFTATAEGTSSTAITVTVGNTKPNDTIVISHKGTVVYKGKQSVFAWESLKSGTEYELEVWTENSKGDKSESQLVKARTKSSSANVIPPVDNKIVVPVATPHAVLPTPAPVVDQPVNDGSSTAKFNDIDRSFNKQKIQALADEGILKGTSDTTFEPYREVTRAEFASMMVRALQLPAEPNTALTFEDIQDDGWYIPELQTAIKHVVARGFSEDVFAPDMRISREQASKMVGNVASTLEGNESFGGFYTDESGIAEWAKSEVLGLTKESLLQGYPDGSFRPKQSVTRQEAAEMIFNLLYKK